MLNENKNIDQIFREKLGDYEKTPPMFLWTNIQGGLNARRRVWRIALIKTVGIAAAIVLAFFAGWQLTSPDNLGFVRHESVAEQHGVNQNITIDPLSNKNSINTDLLTNNSGQVISNPAALTPTVNRTTSSNLSLLATFGANTTFLDHDNRLSAQNQGELALFDTEKDFLEKLQQNFKMVKKLTDWIAAVKKDSIIGAEDSKLMNIDQYRYKTPEGPVAVALNNPARNNKGRWSLKAEFAPVFNSQAQNDGQITYLFSNGSQSYKPQETNTENTFSGGMVAGYKVGKRLIIKSGIVYNNIRQTTQNVDFMGTNSLYNVPGNATLASTPAGQVSLNKAAGTRKTAVLNSSFQLDNLADYSAENELKQDIEFIEIPVQATYKLIDSKFDIGITGGISTNILVGNKAILSENGERISDGETANMRNFVYSGSVGLEMGYEITNRITLTVEPRIKHFLSSLSTSNSVNYKPSQIEIVTGLSYCFN